MPIPVTPVVGSPGSVRRRFPDEGSRLAYGSRGSGLPITGKAGQTVYVYTDAAGTNLATDLQDANGGAITNGQLTIGSDSLIPVFFGPTDLSDTLYVRVGTTGNLIQIWSRYDDRLDMLEQSLGALSTIVDVDELVTEDELLSIQESINSAPFLYRTRFNRRDSPNLALAFPVVANVPPAISYSAPGAGTSLTNPKDWLLDFNETNVSIYGSTFITTTEAGGVNYFLGAGVGNELQPYWFEFITDAPKLEIVYLGSAGPVHRIEINGELTSNINLVATGSSGQPHRLTLDFDGIRQIRKIRIPAISLFVSKITTTQADSLYPPSSKNVKALAVGDSYTQVGGLDGYWLNACAILGWDKVLSNGSGGTGYNNPGPVGRAGIMQDRVAAIIAASPDVVLSAAGINDSPTNLQAQVTLYLQSLREGLPNTPLFVLGPWSASSSQAVAQAAKYAAISAAAGSVEGAFYIDNSTWVTGSGREGTPANNGNADLIISSDAVHPSTPLGHQYLGSRVAFAINNILTAV